MPLSEMEAKFKLSLLNANAIELDRIDMITKLTNAGLPQEVVTRVEDLWHKTMEIAGQIIHIGKVILFEIMKFIEEHRHLAIGTALGVAVGALAGSIPLIGALLAPLLMAVSVVVGAIAGLRLDRGENRGDGVMGVAQDLIVIAGKFFQLFVNIFNAISRVPGA